MHVSGDADRTDQYVTSVIAEVAIARARADVSAAHTALLLAGVASGSEAGVSARVPGTDLFVITPADSTAGEITPDAMILCDLRGDVVTGTPGSESPMPDEAAAHAHVYDAMDEVGGIVHVASPYATGWAARGEAIPCVVTSMADLFGGEVPVVPLAAGDGAELGAAVAGALDGQRSPALLVQNRGAFVVAERARAAARVAVKLEDVARIAQLARQGGAPLALPQDVIDARYLESSARRATGRREPPEDDAPKPVRRHN